MIPWWSLWSLPNLPWNPVGRMHHVSNQSIREGMPFCWTSFGFGRILTFQKPSSLHWLMLNARCCHSWVSPSGSQLISLHYCSGDSCLSPHRNEGTWRWLKHQNEIVQASKKYSGLCFVWQKRHMIWCWHRFRNARWKEKWNDQHILVLKK